ncbi:MAG: DUF502 domain-containing protein [Haloarculaceae archaeon]
MRVTRALKSSFVAGMILVAPLVVTYVILSVLVGWSLQFVNPVVRTLDLARYTQNVQLLATLLGVVLILVLITVVGFLAQKSVGRQLFGRAGQAMNFIPLVGTIYSSVKQVATSLVDRDTGYESVVLVEFPRREMYAIGLVTDESPEEVEPVTGGPAYNVFLPQSPNPTAGKLAIVPAEQVHEIDMSVRRGMRLIVTTGMGEEEEFETLPEIDDEDEVPEPLQHSGESDESE